MSRAIFLLFLLSSFLNGYEDTTSFSVDHSGFYKSIVSADAAHFTDISPQLHSPKCFAAFRVVQHPRFSQKINPDRSLTQMSAAELADYFQHASSEEIFSKEHITNILSDAFVAYIKQFTEYEGYIEHFHEKYHKSSMLKKWWRKNVGKRLCRLHEELKHEKQARQITLKAAAVQRYAIQKLEQQHAHLFAQWQQQLTAACDDHKLRIVQRIQAYHHKNYAALSVQQRALSSQALHVLHERCIDSTQLTSVYGSALEHQLQDEFIQLTEAAVSYQQDPVHLLLVEGIDAGTMALQQKQTVLAAQVADFCWATLDLIQAAGEGVVLAGYNTAAFVHQVVYHPQDTVCGIIDGICAVADTLFIINDLPDQLREHDIPNKEHYYQKIADTEARLEMLGTQAAQAMKEMKLRDWVKHGTAFVVEGFLLHKIINLTANACSRLGSLLGDLAKSVEYEEVVAACIDGERITYVGIASELEKNTVLMNQAENNITKISSSIALTSFEEETESLLIMLNELEHINPNKIHHILQKHHVWGRLCAGSIDWRSVKELLIQTVKYGDQSSYYGLPSRVLKIGEETVEFIYIRSKDGLKISNAWIQSAKIT